MSDTASPSPPEPKGGGLRRCCLVLAALLVLSVCLVLGYAGRLRKASRAAAPLPFQAFRYGPLERSVLTAKFEFLGLPSRLLTGGTQPVEVWLSERELNALLFGDAGHSDRGEKARVVIEDAGVLRLEYSSPVSTEVPQPEFTNVTARIRCSIDPEAAKVELLDGTLGDIAFDPLMHSLVEARLKAAFERRHGRDSRIKRIEGLSVQGRKVRLLYRPEP